MTHQPGSLTLRQEITSHPTCHIANVRSSATNFLDAMPDGSGVAMIDGKMQDDATWKQAKVLVDLANLVAAKDPEMAARYRA